jgi:hypothetical protein
MANNILGFTHVETAVNLYLLIWQNDGKVFSTSTTTFLTYVTANLANYVNAFTELGTASRRFTVTIPSQVPAGNYLLSVHKRIGGSGAEGDPLVGDGVLEWDGAAIMNSPAQVDVVKVNGNTTAAQQLSRMFAAAKSVTVDSATFSPTTTNFETGDTVDSIENYREQVLYGVTGANAGVTVAVTAYAFTNSKVKLTVETLPTAPGNGDIFLKMGRIEQ